ncbi:MAG: hypothetical protein Q9222_004065 [Ikaeria aurantiellina]
MTTTTGEKSKEKQSHTLQNVFNPPPLLYTIPLTRSREVAKTRTQLNRRLADGKKLAWPPFGKAWYAGCTTLIIGNSLKAGIRMIWLSTKKHTAG